MVFCFRQVDTDFLMMEKAFWILFRSRFICVKSRFDECSKMQSLVCCSGGERESGSCERSCESISSDRCYFLFSVASLAFQPRQVSRALIRDFTLHDTKNKKAPTAHNTSRSWWPKSHRALKTYGKQVFQSRLTHDLKNLPNSLVFQKEKIWTNLNRLWTQWAVEENCGLSSRTD